MNFTHMTPKSEAFLCVPKCVNGVSLKIRRVATVGQLLFAPWAWAYSTLHPFGVGN